MYLSKWQKIATLIYAIGIIVIVLALTPHVRYSGRRLSGYYYDDPIYYGTIFVLEQWQIQYQLFFIEIGVWTLFYLLALMLLKTKINKTNSN